MQTITFYLYPNRIDAYTNSLSGPTEERYRRVYNRNLKIVRGTSNRIDFRIYNGDQKKSNIGSQTLVFNLYNKEIGELVLKKDCIVQDSSLGIAYLNLTELDLQLVEPGLYRYTLVLENRSLLPDGNYSVVSRKPLYTDSQYGVESTVEVEGDVFGEPLDSVVISEFSEQGVFGEPKFFVSSLINANPETSIPQSNHTFQFLMSNYTGKVTIEASQSNSSDPYIWSPVAFFEAQSETTHYENIVGKFNWFRVKHQPNTVSSEATFTIAQTILGEYQVDIGQKGKGYKVGDEIKILGSALGGEATTNDLTITVTSIEVSDGAIKTITWTGNSYPGVRTFVKSGQIPTVGSLDYILYR
jgi:hypothetical protein